MRNIPSHRKEFNLPTYSTVKLNTYEKEHMLILETGGVAAIDYVEEIDILVNLIKNVYFSKRRLNKDGKFELVKYLDKDEFLSAQKVYIYVKYLSNQNINDCFIAKYLPNKTNIIDNEVKSISIELHINRQVASMDENLLYRLIYHELTHAKEDIQRRLNYKESIEDIYFSENSSIKYNEVTNAIKLRNSTTSPVAYLIYRLFVETETNALLNEMYADLEAYDFDVEEITRDNYKEVILQTETGQDYSLFKEELKLNYKDKVDWIPVAKSFFNDKFINQFKNDTTFKKWFLRYAFRKLKYIYNKMCQIGETFLKQVEENDINEQYNIIYNSIIQDLNNSLTNQLTETFKQLSEEDLYNVYNIKYFTTEDEKHFDIIKLKIPKLKLKTSL